MSSFEIDLSLLLLAEHFGKIVSNVAKVLLDNGLSPLGLIIKESKESAQNVKKSLMTLIQHNFVSFDTNVRGFVEYEIDIEEVLTIIRYPKYIYVSKVLLGDEAEYMTEELVRHGVMNMSQNIQQVVNRLAQALDQSSDDLVKKVYDVFKKLVSMHFIERSHTLSTNDKQNNFTSIKSKINRIEDIDPYLLPDINLNLIKVTEKPAVDVEKEPKSIKQEPGVQQPTQPVEEPPLKKRKTSNASEEKQKDLNVFWKISSKRFNQYLRDETIVDAIKTHYDDPIAGEITRIILRLSEVRTHLMAPQTIPIAKQDIIREVIKEKVCSDALQAEQYLICFQEDLNYKFIVKSEDRNEGMYSVNVMKTFDKLIESCLSSIVQNRFCSKSARIYRLLIDKKYLQQKQIEDLAMIPSKEAKQLTYNLFMNGLLKCLQCPKTTDYAPSRTYFLFSVDKRDVSRQTLERCYQSVANAINRRLFEVQQNKALLERKTFIDALISSLEQQQTMQDIDQQIQDLKNSITTHDYEVIERVNKNVKKLELSELQIEETIFLLKTWLELNQINNKDSERMDPEIKAKFC